MKITLAQALHLKNRLSTAVEKYKVKLRGLNSFKVEGSSTEKAFNECREKMGKAVEALVQLKRVIAQANNPIWEDIFRLAELKGLAKTWPAVTVVPTEVFDHYQKVMIKYTNVLSTEDIESIVRAAEREIDALQQKLDHFKHTTSVDVEDYENLL